MFSVGADAYDRFMGRFSVPLAPKFAAFAGVADGWHVLDVGCGPGAFTAELLQHVGSGAVTAVDPSESFVAAARARFPGVTVQHASAEQLPFDDNSFDAALAQLVVHFMDDPVGGLREMARVTRPGRVVAACVWDQEGGQGPLDVFWQAARQLQRDVGGESRGAGTREGQLVELLREAGVRSVEDAVLTVTIEHPSFEEWWEPYTLGVGRVGAFVGGLDASERDRLRELCRELLPPAPFTATARAWAARGLA
jgi:ubiquinone/menaquinone biosynthesis C-methylase UbiE